MFTKSLHITLILILLNVISLQPALALQQPQTDDSTQQTAQANKIKARVTKLGTGERARISITRRDNTQLKGYVGEARDADFTIINTESGVSTPVAYMNVKKISRSGLSNGAKVGLIAGGIAAAGLTAYIVALATGLD